MSQPLTLDGRLLCASAIAYAVNADGTFTPDKTSPIYQNACFKTLPTYFAKADKKYKEKINAAILGETTYGLVLAFRGTLPPNEPYNCTEFEDWMNDIMGSTPEACGQLPGKVHTGFCEAFTSLESDITSALDHFYADPQHAQVPLYITGHSKGGPMASYAAYLYKKAGYNFSHITTFASPHPGDTTFAAAYEKLITQVNYANYLDIVPLIPPTDTGAEPIVWAADKVIGLLEFLFPKYKASIENFKQKINAADSWNYAAVGHLRYIDADGKIGPSSTWDRAYSFFENFEQRGFLKGLERIGQAHTLVSCETGYIRAIAPGLCPKLLKKSEVPQSFLGKFFVRLFG